MKTLIVYLAAQGDGGLSMLLMLALMFGIMYFFMIRPQQKKQKEIQNFRNAIERGQQMVTAGGLYGVVKEVDDVNNVLVVEVANGVRVRIDRNSVFASADNTLTEKK
ncbi:MAG: preprotein translocase subunit YajC [Bacteroidaceae bacterium]|nr:preprotein translocase subunit YajC [Bacteroidaceae bacterium]